MMNVIRTSVIFFLILTFISTAHGDNNSNKSETEKVNYPEMKSKEESKCDCLISKDQGFSELERWAWNEKICLGLTADLKKTPKLMFHFSEILKLNNQDYFKQKNGQENNNAKQILFDLLSNRKRNPGLSEEAIFKKTEHLYKTLNPNGKFSKEDILKFANELAGSLEASFISNRFLKTIISPKYSSVLKKNKIEIVNAVFDDGINLNYSTVSPALIIKNSIINNIKINETKFDNSIILPNSLVGEIDGYSLNVGGTLYLANSFFNGNISLDSAEIGKSISTQNSIFNNKFSGDSLKVGNHLFLRNSLFKNSVFLRGSSIGRNLEADAGIFKGELIIDNLKVKGSIFLRNEAVFEKLVNLRGTCIDDNLECDNSTFEGRLLVDAMKVKGAVFFRNVKSFKNEVRLASSIIGGNLETDGSIFEAEFYGDKIKVGGSLFMRNKTWFKDNVFLTGSTIEHSVQLQAGMFEKDVNLTDAKIKNQLILGRNKKDETVPEWGFNSRLLLKNTRIGAIQDSNLAWYQSDSEQFIPTDLRGFQFERLSGYSHYPDEEKSQKSNKEFNFENRSVFWLKRWLSSQIDHNLHFIPGPYKFLAEIFSKRFFWYKIIVVAGFKFFKDSTKKVRSNIIGY